MTTTTAAAAPTATPTKLQKARAWLAALDWHVVLMLGPRHKFTEAEWQLLGQRASSISPSMQAAAIINALGISALLSWMLEPELRAAGFVVDFVMTLALTRVGFWVWRRPTIRSLYLGYLWVIAICISCTFLMGVYAGFMHLDFEVGKTTVAQMGGMLLLVGVLGLWVLAMWRNEFLADWLSDQRLREQADEMARQLSSAQIQPHFLFNSLASLQHWVASKDDRAAPMLNSLTAYLRATLPLFDRPLLSVGEEGEAVQRYLEVMQARLGERLRFRVEISDAAAACQLPPGLLLTLVENAVEHGVQPQLSGGEVLLRAEVLADGSLQVDVVDDGPGLPQALEFNATTQAQVTGAEAGHGLRNSSLRLAQAFGARARLRLAPAEPAGCMAQVLVRPEAAAAPAAAIH